MSIPETADSAVEQVLSAYKDCVRVVGRDLLAEVNGIREPVVTSPSHPIARELVAGTE